MRRSWKKQWLEELDALTPQLREDVLNAPISTLSTAKNADVEAEKKKESAAEFAPQTREKKGKLSLTKALNDRLELLTARLKSKKRFLLRVTATAAAALAICMAGIFALLPSGLSGGIGAFALEINPCAVFTVDEDGIVTAVVAGNAEADVILSSETRKNQIEGRPIEEAMESFVDYAARLGYLDLETGDAIRLSACDKKDDVDAVSETLATYFRKKGVYTAVVAEKISLRSFCQRLETSVRKNMKSLVQALESTPQLHLERTASGKSIEELQSLYTETVSKENLKATVEELLKSNLERAEGRKTSLQEISDFNEEIRKHEDNPGFLFKDYWSVKDFQEKSDYTLRFCFMMQGMEKLLAAHEKTYGDDIRSEFDLKTLQLEASAVCLQEIGELLKDFSMEVFNGSMELLSSVLGVFGVEINVTELCETPQTREEYLTKTKQYNEVCYQSLETEARAAYETERAALSMGEYNAYLDAVTADYGSLSAYWEALNA